jgi:hypothetical protein
LPASLQRVPQHYLLAHAAGQQPTRHYSKPVIDAHVHWYSPEFIELIEKEGAANGVTNIHRNEKGELQCIIPGNHPYAPRADFRREMTDFNINNEY